MKGPKSLNVFWFLFHWIKKIAVSCKPIAVSQNFEEGVGEEGGLIADEVVADKAGCLDRLTG